MTPERPLPRRDRIRRVVILCCDFPRNVTYYRAGSAGGRLTMPGQNEGCKCISRSIIPGFD
jgi:hypothetical protein